MSFIPELGDTVTLTLQRSALGWPTPFECEILTGRRILWKRYCYYRLRWKKPAGSTLDMRWRYEQQYYRKLGWTKPHMAWNSSMGLLDVQIRTRGSIGLK
jgi:hypothetical protein